MERKNIATVIMCFCTWKFINCEINSAYMVLSIYFTCQGVLCRNILINMGEMMSLTVKCHSILRMLLKGKTCSQVVLHTQLPQFLRQPVIVL
jgi:hypothetical protein